MPRRDSDALAVWDAKARSALDRIDAVLADSQPASEPAGVSAGATAEAPHAELMQALVHRVIDRTSPPPGEILTPELVHRAIDELPHATGTLPTPTNMAHQPDRIDHWDAYVCRFDGDDDAEPDRATA